MIKDFAGTPIVVGSVVAFNLSGALAVGVVIKAERKKNFSHQNVHIRNIQTAYFTIDRTRRVDHISKVKTPGVMVLDHTKITEWHKIAELLK